MKPLSIRPQLVEEVYERLLEAISTGRLAAGARLTQEQLAEMLGVSRQPVSHALMLLKKQGLVEEAGRRGLMVADLSPDDAENLYAVRGALDGLAAREAAARVSEVDMVRAERIMEQGRAALAANDLTAMLDADIAFHRAIYEMSGNPVIAETAALKWHQIRRVMGGVLVRRGNAAYVWDEHQAILDAIAVGDPQAAEQAAREHAERAGRELAHHLRQAASDTKPQSGGTRHEAHG